MSVTIILKETAAPGGEHSIVATTPTSQSAFITAAATAQGSNGGFLQITRQDTGGTELVNIANVNSVY